jgi:glycine/serine hydroxymethyltransferase
METRKGIFRDALDSALSLVMMAFPLFIVVVRRFLRPIRECHILGVTTHDQLQGRPQIFRRSARS